MTDLWRRLKETAYLLWVGLWPFGNDARRVYRALGEANLPGEGSLFLNLGYWAHPQTRTLDQASVALADVLADAARLCGADEVLDVGFGFGDQDLHWHHRYGPRRIVGLNITELQVARARERVAREGLSSRIDLRQGSATEVPFEAKSFDKVLALECAFHFSPREQFFKEAFRVLRPGGRLATADILLMPGSRVGWPFTSSWQIPRKNLHARDEYARRLTEAGFVNVQVHSIREHVFGPYLEQLTQRLEMNDLSRKMNPVLRFALKQTWAASRILSRFDYVIALADKPPAALDQWAPPQEASVVEDPVRRTAT